MMMFTQGDLFEQPVDLRVNAVNCVGVMGAGIALAFKTRYPAMFRDYRRACEAGHVQPGVLHVWKKDTEWVVNLPTKRHWRGKSRYEDVEAGLVALRSYLQDFGRVSVAIPALGCGHGGLEWTRVAEMMRRHLDDLEADIQVFGPG